MEKKMKIWTQFDLEHQEYAAYQTYDFKIIGAKFKLLFYLE